MSLSGLWKVELILEKKRTGDGKSLDFWSSNLTKWNLLEKEFEKITYMFELLIEKWRDDTATLNELNLIKLSFALIIKKNKELKKFFEENKSKIEEYEKKMQASLNDTENDLKKYYEDQEKEKLLFYLEYERKLREYKEMEAYYKEIIRKFRLWCNSIEKLQALLKIVDSELGLDSMILWEESIDTMSNFISISKMLPFDETVSMQYLFDKLRITWENNWIQMFSSLNKSIFALFDNIEGEELLDPLINFLYSINSEISEDTFSSIFKDFLTGNIKSEIDLFGMESWIDKNYLLLRDYLMWFKTTVFFRKESYLYLFEVDKELYYVKYRADIWHISQGKLQRFNSEDEIKDFFNNFLKINSNG